jgi:hypothetical protein
LAGRLKRRCDGAATAAGERGAEASGRLLGSAALPGARASALVGRNMLVSRQALALMQ